MEPLTLRIYATPGGRKPIEESLESLKDRESRAQIRVRLERVRFGSLGDWKSVGGGVLELRIDTGPGYRIYLGRDGNTVVILPCGGSKATQRKDIARAQAYWIDYRKEQDAKERTVR